jgi:antitoxin PrlF
MIPKTIREHSRLKPGDRVKFFVRPDGTVVLLPKLPVSALRGIVKPAPRPVTIEEVTAAAAAGAADRTPRAKPRRSGSTPISPSATSRKTTRVNRRRRRS